MQQAKIDFYLRFSRFQQSREKYYAPKLKKELDAQLHHYISTKKFHLSSTGIAKVITNLYVDAATVYGGRIYQDLSKYIKQIKKKTFEIKERKPIGFNERIIQLMNEYFRTDILNTSRGITETTIRHIQDELVRGSGLGLGFDDIIKNLISEDLSANRARLIARTETVTAANRASYIVAVESGLKMNKEWLTSIDNRTRDHHININGTVVGIDEYFILPNGVEMLVPGDRGGTNGKLKVPPGEVCNCRCTTIYIPVLDAQGNAVAATQRFAPVVEQTRINQTTGLQELIIGAVVGLFDSIEN